MARTREIVLITGGSGFIGRALAERLAARFEVVGLDVAEPKEPVPGVETVRIDLTSDRSVREALGRVRSARGGRLASVIHLAAYYDLSGEPDPKYQAITVEGTRRLLHELRSFVVGQFVFASTMLVHAPCEPGQRINEDWPLAPKWAYPESKVEAESLVRAERGPISVVILRPAGIYDDTCRAAFLAQQIARIHERSPLSYLFAGDPSHGQPYLHLDDLVDAVERVVERRDRLPIETILLLGEEETPSYSELQRRLGRLLHGEAWPTRALPKPLVQAGAWLQDDVLGEDPFVRPWMVEIADDHYALDTSRARELLGWRPRCSLLETLPRMIAALKDDPPGWYARNKLNPAQVAAADEVIEEAAERLAEEGPGPRDVEAELRERHRQTLWAHLANVALGAWLVLSPFAYGLFDPAPNAAPPPAAGHPLSPPELRDAWLGLSEMASGAAVILFSATAMARLRSWAQWAAAAVGIWVLLAPLVFWTTSPAAYAVDTLVGMLVVVFAVMVPAQPGISRDALASDSDLPLGWSYSPSSYVQRAPIVALAFVGLFVSRYLAAFQLGHIDSVWDPFFGGTAGVANGTEAVITSSVSKVFPIADAGFGAFAYVLDILTGAVGDKRRWRTMPWLVLIFGLLIVPLGAVSVVFIIIQPSIIGALCTLCLLQAAVTVVLIPYSIDEVLATCQYLLRAHRAGLPFWHTLLRGGPALGEGCDPAGDLDAPFLVVVRDFVSGGVTFPWTLAASVALGTWLMCTPLVVGAEPPLYWSDHVTGCLVITIAVTAMAEVVRPLRFLNVLLGLWVMASPFILGSTTTAPLVADIIVGGLLALLSLPRGRRSDEHYGGWDRFIV